MRAALDTNILVYAAGVNGLERRDETTRLLRQIPAGDIVVPAQVLAELYNVLVKKGGVPREDVSSLVSALQNFNTIVGTAPETLELAVDLATSHHLSIWDSIVLAAAASSGCRILLSEDLQHGFTWSGVTVVNPFQEPRHPLLTSLLGMSQR